MDAVPSTPNTIHVDFNARQIPCVSKAYDYVVCSGVMEYIIPVHLLLEMLGKWGRTVIISYAVTGPTQSQEARRKCGWLNHFSDSRVRGLFARHGLRLQLVIPWERQLIYVLDSSKTIHSYFNVPQEKDQSDITSVFRYDPSNAGDFFCAPLRYLNFGSLRCADILNLGDPALLSSRLVIGGGGLLSSKTFNPCFEKLLERDYEFLIGWGLGDNARYDSIAGYTEQIECRYPDFLNRFSLVGVRDYGTAFPWVPCASCLHPLFAEKWAVQHEVVVFEHKRIPIPIADFPRMSNNTNDFQRVLAFLGSARVVITNSYHAAYWSQLLGKGVLAFPFSTKFYQLKHRVTLCRPAEWKRHLDRVESQPSALKECIEANLGFAEKVRSLIGWPRQCLCLSDDFAPSEIEACDLRLPANEEDRPATDGSRSMHPKQSHTGGGQNATLHSVEEIRVERAMSGSEMEAFLVAIPEDAVVEIGNSEDEGFDALKMRLCELEHVGRSPETRKQIWRGSKRQRSSCPSLDPEHRLPTIISFYTIDTPYAELANRLRESCKTLGLDYRIEGIESKGSWEFNCATKARFILDQWRRLKVPVLWVDADALVRRKPSLLAGTDADFAVHKIERWEMASGTIYFNQTNHAQRLLERWGELCRLEPAVWDQHHLDAAWEEMANLFPLKTIWLPQSYTKVFDRPILPGEDTQPVIEHFQASRQFKRTVSNLAPTPFKRFSDEFRIARSVSRPFLTATEQRSHAEYQSDDHLKCANNDSRVVLGSSRKPRLFTEYNNPQARLLSSLWKDAEIESFVDDVLNVCGVGPKLLVGEHAKSMSHEFLRRGISASHVNSVDDMLHRSLPNMSFESIVLIGTVELQPSVLSEQLVREFWRVTCQSVLLHLDISDVSETHARTFWQDLFFQGGFRHHPLGNLMQRNYCSGHRSLVLAFEHRPTADARITDDWGRLCGSQSDALQSSYTVAARQVRPGDTVVELGCGCGFGLYLMHRASRGSRFLGVDSSQESIEQAKLEYCSVAPLLEFQHALPATALRSFPDNSIHLLVCRDLQGSGLQSESTIPELLRVVVPGGHLLVGDSSESSVVGSKLHEALGGCFYVEAVIDPPAGTEGQWLLAMKNPLSSPVPEYRETVFGNLSTTQHVSIRYAEFYRNPWIIHSLVHIGYRTVSPKILTDCAKQLLLSEPPGNPDHGAALCLLLYRALSGVIPDGMSETQLVDQATAILGTLASNKHQLRWQVSLSFVLGLLHTHRGRFAEARKWFECCAALDPLVFSVHLSTKTTEALFLSGWLAFTAGDLSAARSAWERGLAFGNRLTSRPLTETLMQSDFPNLFDYGDGMRELIYALENVARCANGIHCLRLKENNVPIRWDLIHNCFRFQHETVNRALRVAQGRVAQLCSEVDEARKKVGQGTRESAQELRALQEELDGSRAALRERTAELDAERATLRSRTEELDRDRQALRERGAELDQARQETQKCAHAARVFHERVGQLSAELDKLRSSNARKGV